MAKHFITRRKLDSLTQHLKKPLNEGDTSRWEKREINGKSISNKSKMNDYH